MQFSSPGYCVKNQIYKTLILLDFAADFFLKEINSYFSDTLYEIIIFIKMQKFLFWMKQYVHNIKIVISQSLR